VKKKNLLIAIYLLVVSISFSQEQLRLMSYNILNYPNSRNGSSIAVIEPHYKNIINKINPDLLVVVEMVQQSGVTQFLNNVLGSDYAAANVTIKGTNSSGYDGNDCAFYYKPSKVKLIETKEISARTRVISSFKVVSNSSNDTLIILGIHLKANDPDYITKDNNALNQQKRTDAVISLRKETDTYNPKTNFLVCGDFNIFSSDEQAFQKLVDKTNSGYVIDMTNSIGNWSGDPKFSSVCTHSSTKLDTRLDMILISQSLVEKGGVDYVDGSFKIFGNDGNQFNKNVANTSNAWFINEPQLAVSVTTASDHLPIYADFSFGVKTNIDENKSLPNTFELYQNYPNPFNPNTTIKYSIPMSSFDYPQDDKSSAMVSSSNHDNKSVSPSLSRDEVHVTLKIYDMLGREVATLVNENQKPGIYNYQFSISNYQLSSGLYFYQLKAGEFIQTRKMILMK
jgi:endonuclease/exonuclease/phosphatase family metal-dependent hydrolase